MNQFTAVTDAVGGSLGLSALVGTLPLLAFFVMLIGVKTSAHVSAAVATLTAIVVAVLGFNMPIDLALSATLRGALFGLLPIVWVIVMAIWFYQITVASGRFEDLRRTFDKLGDGDVRIQAILIAFCFGGLLEALAGFGAPVAITATMILALGIKPLKAATVVLLANTAPVAFGAVAIPITTAGAVGGRTLEQTENIAAIVGHQAPLIAVFVPAILLIILDGFKGLKEAWVPAFVIGFAFAIAQWATSNFFAYQLTDVVACIVSLGAAFVFLRFWDPRGVDEMRKRMELPPAATSEELPPMRVWMALLPYAVVTVVFGVANLGSTIPDLLKAPKISFDWPLLADRLVTADGDPVNSSYTLLLIHNPGSLLLISGLIVAVIYAIFTENGRYKLTAGEVVNEFTSTAYRMRWSALTITLVLGLAYVMNYSGQTVAIGQFVASLGGAYAFLAPSLGWVGTAVTGSDTSANALFSKMQVTAANTAGINPDLMLAANTSGGVVGKMVSPQSLAIAATAVKMEGRESEIFKAVVWWSLGMLFVVCSLVFLQTNVLSFMAPIVP
ncbi:L-lactate permease [Corynebacterium sp. ES2794-CONJ1]|uniref:L-lactate permease n=1 Tax=unclassified Corynebacterium TaxID=2624378 RepID=UPI002169209B|nr:MULTISPECIES: L-lactate permease [unclassified Corynebacterium]MCS4489837.1 L-lactate permease [Corynebacterium sp. ES2775-CONJ]MCS4491799.1 L-lactate permease [Corynebacterium sp. ES2715-CONJ3]MCS4531904.1 L-lactate permease [Corynebacterium sp. ES2730-CONJ]MCU9519305.1 L-lactate permease [Corynebacterium sp. ES2794-CONJ1]